MWRRRENKHDRSPKSWARRAARPGCEALEGRALLATWALDPTFGTGGAALGPLDPGSGPALSVGTAVAVGQDGKILVAGTNNPAIQYGGAAELLVRRYDADGTLDATFGTGGQATIPLPTGSAYVQTAPNAISVASDGSIVLAATVAAADGQYTTTPYEGLIARLTPTGQLDTSFATGGEYVAADATGGSFVQAVQADGSVVFAGSVRQGNTLSTVPYYLVGRLTPAGVLDTSFNTTGELQVPYPYTFNGGTPYSLGLSVNSIAIDASGNIDLGANVFYTLFSHPIQSNGTLVQVAADGTLVTTFGTSGIAKTDNLISAIATQADGKIIALGSKTLERYTTAGSLDASFAGRTATTPTGSIRPTDLYSALVVAPDGSITVAGATPNGATVGGSTILTSLLATRFTADGAVDTSFGTRGRINVTAPSTAPAGTTLQVQAVNGLALTPTGDVVVGGAISYGNSDDANTTLQSLVARFRPVKPAASPADFDGDGKTDVAAQLTGLGLFAYRKSTGGDVLTPFGAPGITTTIPAPGDYDGDGKADVAAYLSASGTLVYRPSSGGPDVQVPFGSAGAGQSIPVPGDYDGDGKTDVAVYLPAYGAFAIDPSDGTPPYLFAFGSAGAGASIPAVGDYDGDGKTDLAVYLPAYGALAVHPSDGSPNYLVTFGSAGPNGSIPAPGDYDGDGKTDLAVYLPAYGALAVDPSGTGQPYLVPFGSAGVGNSIPAPGDYDGDGKTDVAVYLPAYGEFAIRPSGGGAPYLDPFGAQGGTVPATSSPAAFGTTVAASALPGPAAPATYLVALTPDLLPPTPGANKPRK